MAGRVLGQGQAREERAPGRIASREDERAAMGFGDGPRDRQAQTGSVRGAPRGVQPHEPALASSHETSVPADAQKIQAAQGP